MDSVIALGVLGGLCAMLGGHIWFLLIITRANPSAGALSVFIPFISLLFIRRYWNAAKPAVLTWVSGAVTILIGVAYFEVSR